MLITDVVTYFKNLTPFKSIDDIPDILRVDKSEYQHIIDNLIRCGAIPKKDLVIGKTYLGSCRNSSEATWNGVDFEYVRYKFGTSYIEHINHFEDDDGFDLFIPLYESERSK